MDSLPYIDPPNGDAYETYALSLIQEEMNRRQPPDQKTETPDLKRQNLRPTGTLLVDRKTLPIHPSSTLEDHVEVLNRAKRAYEAERLRHLQLSSTSETPYKVYNETVRSGWPNLAVKQQATVEEVNHKRKTYQESVQPQLNVAEAQYQELVQKNLQLRSAIQELRSDFQPI